MAEGFLCLAQKCLFGEDECLLMAEKREISVLRAFVEPVSEGGELQNGHEYIIYSNSKTRPDFFEVKK